MASKRQIEVSSGVPAGRAGAPTALRSSADLNAVCSAFARTMGVTYPAAADGAASSLSGGAGAGGSQDVVREDDKSARDGLETGRLPFVVHVGGPSQDSEKMVSIPSRLLMGARASARGGGGKRGKLEEIKFRLPFAFADTTAAGTTYTTVVSLTPSTSTEWTALTALYDECIVDGGEFHWTNGQVVTYTTTSAVLWYVVFDPLASATLSSVANAEQHSQHHKWAYAPAMYVQNPTPVSRNGYTTFKWRTPKSAARTAGSSALFGHEWSSTSDASDAYGYLKFYCKSPGATGTTNFDGVIVLHMRFRSRT